MNWLFSSDFITIFFFFFLLNISSISVKFSTVLNGMHWIWLCFLHVSMKQMILHNNSLLLSNSPLWISNSQHILLLSSFQLKKKKLNLFWIHYVENKWITINKRMMFVLFPPNKLFFSFLRFIYSFAS